jgi:predicted RNase H-like HicB family nuclease
MEAGVSTYAIIIERGDTGSFGAYSPDLPGCVAVADDLDECVQLMREAIEFHLEGLREDGLPLPQPGTVAATTFTTAA